MSKLSSEDITEKELSGEETQEILTEAPDNSATIGGLKVLIKNGWFAVRFSGTNDIFKIYAESFRAVYHLRKIFNEAQQIVDNALIREKPV